MMTPNDIEVLLHCYATPKRHPRFTAPAVQDAIIKFIKTGCITATPGAGSVWRTTARGDALVKMLRQTPMPVQQWVDPRTGKEP